MGTANCINDIESNELSRTAAGRQMLLSSFLAAHGVSESVGMLIM